MTDKKRCTQSELLGVGHDYLRWAREQAIRGEDELTVQGLAAVGILATLLRIADDISTLAAVAWEEREI